MEYKEHISLSRIKFEINEHLLECQGIAWQIRNIVATFVVKHVIPNREPEPKADLRKPKLDLNFPSLILSPIIAWLIIAVFFRLTNFAIFFAIGIFVFIILNAVWKYRKERKEWTVERENARRKMTKWEALKNEPLVLYSLVLETTAGRKSLFYSPEQAKLLKANDALKAVIEKTKPDDTTFEIDTVDINGSDSIDAFCIEIYRRIIDEA